MATNRTVALFGLALLLGGITTILGRTILPLQPQIGIDVDGFTHFPGLYEPSGVAQLTDGRLLVIEDEPSQPFTLVTYHPSAMIFELEALRPPSLLDKLTNRTDDLEGITTASGEHIYAITSHSRKANGKRSNTREKLIRFEVTNHSQTNVEVRSDLRKRLMKKFPALEKAAKKRGNVGGLNIEGLTFDKTQQNLWIAFRSPLIKKKAVLVKLLDPDRVMTQRSKLVFDDDFLLLDLDSGGIRDIAFDPHLDGYLVLSQEEGTKKEKAFKLWFWTGDAQYKPRRIRIAGIKNLHRAEGVASVLLHGNRKILLLSDDGLRVAGQSARYTLLDYAQIKIDKAQ